MDWSKAKNILIAALLITNLILGTAIYNNANSSAGREQETIKQNTILLLQGHRIYVEEDIVPGRTERLPVMSVRYRTVSRDGAAAAIAASGVSLAPTASEDEYRRAAERVLDMAGVPMEIHEYEEIIEEGTRTIVRFGTKYQGYFLDNAKVQVIFRGGVPRGLSETWAEPVSMGQNRKRVLPAHEALIRFMTLLEEEQRNQASDEVREDIHVEQIRLVYWLEGYTENGGVSEDTAVPYWCIQYNDGNSVHIAAYEE